eukprot:845494-Pelagomonas_calceolata.AAC.1
MPIGEAFFKHLKPRRVPALVRRALRNLDSGQYAVPASYQVLLKFPAEELKNMQRRPMKVMLPENRLMHKFYMRHPEVRCAEARTGREIQTIHVSNERKDAPERIILSAC